MARGIDTRYPASVYDQEQYETSPHIGDRRSTTLLKKQKEETAVQPPKTDQHKKKIDKDLHLEYSWNASTMSQALRRMQYAVRGEVVMAAEKLAAAGREIIYTKYVLIFLCCCLVLC